MLLPYYLYPVYLYTLYIYVIQCNSISFHIRLKYFHHLSSIWYFCNESIDIYINPYSCIIYILPKICQRLMLSFLIQISGFYPSCESIYTLYVRYIVHNTDILERVICRSRHKKKFFSYVICCLRILNHTSDLWLISFGTWFSKKYNIYCPSLNRLFMGGIVLYFIGITDPGTMHNIRVVTICII